MKVFQTAAAVCLVCLFLFTTAFAGCDGGVKEEVEDPFTGKKVKLCSKDAVEVRKQMGEINAMAEMAKAQVEAMGVPSEKSILKKNSELPSKAQIAKNKAANADLFN
jgi:hypothetical protein|eukprot:Stramenopile-MAST_4_protein_4600